MVMVISPRISSWRSSSTRRFSAASTTRVCEPRRVLAKIFENSCKERGLPFDPSIIDHLLQYYRPRKIALRGCQPRDLIEQALSLAEYLGEPRRVTPNLLDAACASYFVDDREAPAAFA